MPAANSITGLNSGLDWSAIIDATIRFERNNAVLLEYEQAKKQAIVSAYQALQAKFFGLSAELSKLARPATFEQSMVSVSDESVLSATVDGSIGTGSYDIQVLSVARNHQLASQGFSDEFEASFGTGTISIQVGDAAAQEITIDSGNNSLSGIQKAINDADLGVTASTIYDGSASNPYRLLLSADSTGIANNIAITSSLTGGENLNYSGSSFDSPETLVMDTGSSSQISLGATAAYSGAENKIYTFTVGGTGTQTIGSDNITLDWTDGTNSGSIIVTQADTEVELVGTGADGLTLTFSAGDLTAGDTLQVGTFSPLLQQASDARITLGSTGGGGSPITVNSKTNSFDNLVGGLSVNIFKETASGESVTINTDQDIAAVKAQIESFITKFNNITDYIEEQNTYDQNADTAGALFGDSTIWSMQESLRSLLSSTIPGIESDFRQLYSIGIRTKADGTLAITDSARLDAALRDNLDDVISLFACDANSSNSYIQYISSTSKTTVGEALEVDITQAPTQGSYQGTEISNPATSAITLNNTNNRLKLVTDGLTSNEIILTAKTYETTDELIREIQTQIDNDLKIGSRGIEVEWIATDVDAGYISIISSTFGSTSSVDIADSQSDNAFTILGLSSGEKQEGLNVAGTINGEEAEGTGVMLVGKEGNATTEGLKLKITLNEGQVGSGVEGTITITKGKAAQLAEFVDSVTMSSDGTFDRRISSYQKQIELLAERVEDIDELLEIRRQSLYEQYYEMETIMGRLNSQSTFLTTQLDSLNANWALGR